MEKRMVFKTTKLLVIALTIFVSQNANAVFIDFDSHAATSQTGGTPPASAVVTDDYASLGVIFGKAGVSAGVAVVNNSNTFSQPNGACAMDAGGDLIPNCAGDIFFNFVDQSDGVSLAVTDSVDFWVGDIGGDLDLWTINVFDISGGLIETRDVSSAANINVAFNHFGMHSFEILDTSFNTYGYLFDDFSFNAPTAAVPEPTMLILLSIGLFGIGFVRRKA